MSLATQLQEQYKDDVVVQASAKKELVCKSEWKCKGEISLYYQVANSWECLNCGCRIPGNRTHNDDKVIGPCLIRHEPYNDMPFLLTCDITDETLQKLHINWQIYLESHLPSELEHLVIFDSQSSLFCATCETEEPVMIIANNIQAMIITGSKEAKAEI